MRRSLEVVNQGMEHMAIHRFLSRRWTSLAQGALTLIPTWLGSINKFQLELMRLEYLIVDISLVKISPNIQTFAGIDFATAF